MKVFISVVCHQHEKLIIELDCLAQLASHADIIVILKNNHPLKDTNLVEYCSQNNIVLLDESYHIGFGENNNYVYDYSAENLNLSPESYFLVLNPDVYIEAESILNAVTLAQGMESELVTVNLFKDKCFKTYDLCVRSFPSAFDFISSYVGLGNKTTIDKNHITEPKQVDWAAGSFLLFKASLFHKIGGFDSKYFMYCEDIDICWRAQKLYSQKLTFLPNIKAIHFAQHANRSFISKHFIWHVKSMLRYLTMYYGLRKPSKINHITKNVVFSEKNSRNS